MPRSGDAPQEPSDAVAPPEAGRWSRLLFRGDEARRRALAGEVLARVAARHSPDHLVVVVCASPSRCADWAWTRWLPHAGSYGRVVCSPDELTRLLGSEFAARPPFAPGVKADGTHALAVVVVDDVAFPPGHRLDGEGFRDTVVFDVSGARRRPGRTVLRLDTDADPVRAAWTGPNGTERSAGLHAATIAELLTADAPAGSGPEVAGRPLIELVDGAGPGFAEGWPPPLDTAPGIDHLLPPLVPTRDRGLTTADVAGGFLTVPVGLVDRPFERIREVLRLDLSGARGHVAIVGGPGSGRSTVATTLISALALTHTPREVQCYVLSSSGTLRAASGLPHVGAVISDADRAGSVIARITALLAHRERLFRDHDVSGMADFRRRREEGEFADEAYGDVLLLIDDTTFVSGHGAAVNRMAAEGLGHGVHLVLTAEHTADLPGALTGRALHLGLHPAGPAEPEGAAVTRPGSGRTTGDDATGVRGLPWLAALPRIDGVAGPEELIRGVASLAAEVAGQWSGRPVAAPIGPLPELVASGTLPAPDGPCHAVLGVTDGDLTSLTHDFAVSPHLTVIGALGSGRTNTLRLVAESIVTSYSPGEARILVVDRDGGLLQAVPDDFMLGHAYSASMLDQLVDGAARAIGERLPGPEIDPARWRSCDWWHGPRLFVLVDDYEEVRALAPDPFAPMLAHLGMGYEVGVHLVVAHATEATEDRLLHGLGEAGGATLTLSGGAGEEPPPGRAAYHANGGTFLVQIARAGH